MTAAGAQVPAAGEIFLDHLGWFVPDLAEAGRAFERLGFVLTPESIHQNRDASGNLVRAGTANRCAMIERGYIEILAGVPGINNPITAELHGALARHAGIHLIALTCADTVRESERLTKAGFAPQSPVALRRPIETDSGKTEEAAFSVIRVAPGTFPEGRVQMLCQETPDTVWQPSLIAHDNAITGLSGLISCSKDPKAGAVRFAKFSGKPALGNTVALDRGRLEFWDPRRLAEILPAAAPPSLPFNAAIMLESANLSCSRAWFRQSGLDFVEIADGVIALSPEAACGAWMVVHAPGIAWPGGLRRAIRSS